MKSEPQLHLQYNCNDSAGIGEADCKSCFLGINFKKMATFENCCYFCIIKNAIYLSFDLIKVIITRKNE